MTAIKICGLTRVADVDVVNELLPDYVGFVFAGGSRRFLSPAAALRLRDRLDPSITVAGVFVDAEVSLIADLCRDGVIDVAQLHGNEPDTVVRRLQRTLPVMKAIQASRGGDVAGAANSSPADLVLVDAGTGGTGRTFDWSLTVGIERPFFLAGGLSPDNICEAIAQVAPFGVDVSSGVEVDGVKSAALMSAFVAAVRELE